MALSLANVIIVGASSGMGAALARQLARRGSSVAAVARRTDQLEALRAAAPDRIRTYRLRHHRRRPRARAVRAHHRRSRRRRRARSTPPGVMPPIDEGEYTFEKDRAMVEVNLLGAMAWMNLAAARFEAARAGTIVGISSVAGERGRRKNPAYAATKAALSTYLEALRNRCSRYGVNVVTVKPGFVDTDMTRGMPGLFWLISADEAAAIGSCSSSIARNSASGFVPPRWAAVARSCALFPRSCSVV